MAGLKTNLGEARRLLAARHKALQQQWYRSITLRHVLQLLDQIDSVAKVPARIERLMLERKYYAATQLLLHSSSMLEREGIQGVSRGSFFSPRKSESGVSMVKGKINHWPALDSFA